MHWTAFLAYRRFPANARVMEDCACIQCGYNLRMQMLASRCPECGHEVGNSVFLLARPAVAARGIRTAGLTYLAPLVMLLPLVHPALWSLVVASGALAAAGVFRLIGVSDLRFNAALARLPVVGTRLQLWWAACIADLLISAGWCTTVLVIAYSLPLQGPRGDAIISWLLIAWWLIAMLSAWAAGRFGYAVMDMLGYVWTRFEFGIQQVAVMVVIALAPFMLIGIKAFSSPVTLRWIEGALALLTGFALLVTAVPLLHAATAAEESAETWDDALEQERIALVPEAALPRKPEPPPIRID